MTTLFNCCATVPDPASIRNVPLPATVTRAELGPRAGMKFRSADVPSRWFTAVAVLSRVNVPDTGATSVSSGSVPLPARVSPPPLTRTMPASGLKLVRVSVPAPALLNADNTVVP